jgi:hypothetical protein
MPPPADWNNGVQLGTSRAEMPVDRSDPTDKRQRIVSLSDPTPFGVTGDELLAHITGQYRGTWNNPLGDFIFELQAVGDNRVEITEVNAVLPPTPDQDGDGVHDGSVELRFAVDCSLTTANERLRVDRIRSQMNTTSAHALTASGSIAFADLDSALTGDLFGTLPTTCDSIIVGLVWKAPDTYEVAFVVDEAATGTNCALFKTTRITRMQ